VLFSILFYILLEAAEALEETYWKLNDLLGFMLGRII
jgi:hypothetical protein